MAKQFLPILIIVVTAASAGAQTVQWKDVAPIIYNNCTTCHRTGGIAPFALASYQDASARANSIKHAVLHRHMPPWPADPTYRSFVGERVLSESDLNKIIQWADAGAPAGDISLAPKPPVFSSRFEIASPDLKVVIPTYVINTVKDLYQCFVIPSGTTADQFITEVEVIPGNAEAVHHVQVFLDPSRQARQRDQNSPGPGYPCFGGTGVFNTPLITGWVPGGSPMRFPEGMGEVLPAGADIIVQVHYPGGLSNKVDSTQVRMKLSKGPLREITFAPILNHVGTAGFLGGLENGPLTIPANTKKTFTARFDVPNTANFSLLSIFPHMHLIGREIVCYGVTPAKDTIPLVRVNDWDFHWQLTYTFKKLIKIPAGTKVYAKAVYDNTVNNPHNPNNPPKTVTGGEATTDEMLLVYFAYMNYLPGDENFSIDSSLLVTPVTEPHHHDLVGTLQLYDPFPNPAVGETITIPYFLPEASQVNLQLLSSEGRQVRSLHVNRQSGFQAETLSLNGLPDGMYFLEISDGQTRRVKQVAKNGG